MSGARSKSEIETHGPGAVDPELESELAGIVRSCGLELLRVERRGNVLRLILDRPDQEAEGADGPGVNLGDCELVSKQASAFLEVVDFGKSRYVLEVSSPGLDRELYGPRDFARFAGRLARVTFDDPGGRQQTVVGRLREPAGEMGVVTLDVEDGGKSAGPISIAFDRIRKARLEIEI